MRSRQLTASSMRTLTGGVLLSLLSACAGPQESTAPLGTGDTGPSLQISDAVHSEGNTRFYFLPPMVPAPTTHGVFDGGLSPVVEVCEWTGACGAVVARFNLGSGSSAIRVEQAAEHYVVNWKTDECVSGPCSLSTAMTYRLRILVGAQVLGYADLDVVASGAQLKNVQTNEYIGLIDGRTLPVKFRIEQGVVGSVAISPDPATVEVGQSVSLGALVRDLHGTVLSDRSVSWSTTDLSVATIASNGVATGVAPGCTSVRAAAEGVFGTAVLCVTTPPVIDVATAARSNSFLPGVGTPVLAQWGDGSILLASAYPNNTSYTVNAAGPGPASWTTFNLSGSRPSIWIPQNEPFPETALGGYDRLRAQSRNNTTLWEDGTFGCCSQILGGYAIEPTLGIAWRLAGQVRTNLRSGTNPPGNPGVGLHDTYITPDHIWEVRGGANFVVKRGWYAETGVQMPLPAVHTIIPISQVQLHGALTSAMGYVHPTTEDGGYLTHFGPGGMVWSRVVPGVGAPVITGQDLVVAGSTDASGHRVLALRLADGSEAWNVPMPRRVQDVVVGDGGNLYVLLDNAMYVLDAVTGALRSRYVNFADAVEMLLSNGSMYVVTQVPGGGARLIVLSVPSINYDPLSPWPLRFGDNQRTRHLPASRVR